MLVKVAFYATRCALILENNGDFIEIYSDLIVVLNCCTAAGEERMRMMRGTVTLFSLWARSFSGTIPE